PLSHAGYSTAAPRFEAPSTEPPSRRPSLTVNSYTGFLSPDSSENGIPVNVSSAQSFLALRFSCASNIWYGPPVNAHETSPMLAEPRTTHARPANSLVFIRIIETASLSLFSFKTLSLPNFPSAGQHVQSLA
ncbi:hypothetical protein CORC01_07250, partial [Colletotrichum orchidophilum]